jgi:hypothetical protein
MAGWTAGAPGTARSRHVHVPSRADDADGVSPTSTGLTRPGGLPATGLSPGPAPADGGS